MLHSGKQRSARQQVTRKAAIRQAVRTSAFFETLEARQHLDAAPNVAPVLDLNLIAKKGVITVPAGKSLILPFSASDANGDPLTYSFKSSNKSIKVIQRKGNPYLKLTIISGVDRTPIGTMTFELFKDTAPTAVGYISSLVAAEFYNGKTFHRIADLNGGSGGSPGYIVQGGRDNSGGSSPFTFDDQFDLNSIFSGIGQLAMAKSTDDTNGTEFFVTGAPVRHLDFNHTIFGQLVRGLDIFNKLVEFRPSSGDSPTYPPIIQKAEIIKNRTDSVITLTAPKGASGNLTVYVSDGKGGLTQQTFTVKAAPDSIDQTPFLAPLPDLFVPKDTPITIPKKAFDLDGSAYVYVTIADGVSGQYIDPNKIYQDASKLVFQPIAGYTGPIKLKFRAYRKVDYDAAPKYASGVDVSGISNYDEQTFTIAVGEQAVTRTQGKKVKAVTATKSLFWVASFKDPDSAGKATDYTAKIYWQDDSQVSDGTVVKGKDGLFWVSGEHTYKAEGKIPFTVILTHKASGAKQFITGGLATVKDAPLTEITPVSKIYAYPGDENKVNAEKLLTFKDTDPSGSIEEYTAVIDWGDGSGYDTTSATFSKSGSIFTVKGSHTYTQPQDGPSIVGDHVVRIWVTSKGGSRFNTTLTAVVARPSLTINAGSDVSPDSSDAVNEGAAWTRTVNFTDTDDSVEHEYEITVDYGDGTPVQTVTANGTSFQIGHTWADSGTYTILVTMLDKTTNTVAFDKVKVVVKNVAPTATVEGALHTVPGQLFKLKLIGDDVAPADKNGMYFWINWGDGTSENLTGSTVTAMHAYSKLPDAGGSTYTITITVYDKEYTSTVLTRTMNISAVDVQEDPNDPTKKMLVVGGTNGPDVIRVVPLPDNKAEVWIGSDTTAPVSKGIFQCDGRIQVWGGDGNDSITVARGFRGVAELFGGAGNDTLTGSDGNDILVGDGIFGAPSSGGYDKLFGGKGDDILIGGTNNGTNSNDTEELWGQDGNDLLIAGYTSTGKIYANSKVLSYDSDPEALRMLAKEWLRTDVPYATKIAHLTNKPSGSLNTKNYKLTRRTTFSDTHSISTTYEVLRGGAGNDLFFADIVPSTKGAVTKDFVMDKAKNETVIDI